ncbi:hypothetical protein [Bdellovibrio sp. HCB-110]|uniref:hypothetical protein n=1 Tax=Bdellovibrio sp. HCB-110 TaxID=3391182 RepID=UPI0039B3AF2A
MKSILMTLALSFAPLMAQATVDLAIKSMPAFPLRGPSAQRPASEHEAHNTFKCWIGGMKSITPTYDHDTLKSAEIFMQDPACAPQGLTLKFDVTSRATNGLIILNLVSPAIENTPLAAYKNPELVLSLSDLTAGFRPNSLPTSVPLMHFRVIFNHAYSYDPSRYGQFGAEFLTLHKWQRTAITLVKTETHTLPPGCLPRFPKMSCTYTTSLYNMTFENSLTGKILETSFEEVTQ